MIAPTLDDAVFAHRPPALDAIERETVRLGFTMASEPKTGALLATLAATKPGGRALELGTGTGIGTAWLLAGMDAAARLDTVDTDPRVVGVARTVLGSDARVAFHLEDGAAFIARASAASYDLVYADAWPGKFSHLTEALALLRPGGLYVIDDLLPQANWPDGHGDKVRALVADLEGRADFSDGAAGLGVRPDARRPTDSDATMRTALVVGAGIGGLAAGIALRQAGWRARVFERAANPRELGFALNLAPNAMAALASLGLAEALLGSGHRTRHVEVRRGDGRPLKRFEIPVGLAAHPPMVALRQALHGALLGATPADDLELGREAAGFTVTADGVRLTFRDGTTVDR